MSIVGWKEHFISFCHVRYFYVVNITVKSEFRIELCSYVGCGAMRIYHRRIFYAPALFRHWVVESRGGGGGDGVR